MRKSINEFNRILTETEKLSTTQLCLVRGGDGEDLRRNSLSFSLGGTTITITTTSTTSTTLSGTVTATGTITGTVSGTVKLKK